MKELGSYLNSTWHVESGYHVWWSETIAVAIYVIVLKNYQIKSHYKVDKIITFAVSTILILAL